MKLFFRNDTDDLTATQSGTLLEAGTESITLFGGQTLNMTYPLKAGYVIESGRLELKLNFVTTDEVTITPTIFISDRIRDEDGNYVPDPDTADITYWSAVAEATNEPGQDTLITWDVVVDFTTVGVPDDQDLTNHVIILRLAIAEIDPGASITFASSSYVNLPITEGSTETLEVWTQARFSLFEIRERIYLWSTVNVYEGIDYSFYTSTRFNREFTMDYWTTVNAYEHVVLRHYLDLETILPTDMPAIWTEDVELDDYILTDNFELKQKMPLSQVLHHLDDIPEVRVPPMPYPTPEYSHPLSGAAWQMYLISEMLLNEVDEDTPTSTLQAHKPGALYGGDYEYRSAQYGGTGPEWQLPAPYLDQYYTLQLPTLTGSYSTGVFALLKERYSGAFVNAYLDTQPGQVVLQREISSSKRVTVWYWSAPAAPFNVTIKMKNPTLLMPGFAGLGAAVMGAA